METGKLIPLNRSHRLMRRARFYLTQPDLFFEDPENGVSALLDALPFADTSALLKMIPLLGYAGRDRVLWPIYHLMSDRRDNEQVRHTAAIQLGLAASLSDDPSPLNRKLIADLDHPDSAVRSASALALGWYGNTAAVNALFAHLDDTDRDAQAAMVTALTSIGGKRVLDGLKNRLKDSDIELQRSILLNIWRFSDVDDDIETVYLEWVHRLPDDMGVDILIGMSMLPLSANILSLYDGMLTADDPRIRRQVLENLSANDPADFSILKVRLASLLTDADDGVRQMAIRLQRRF